GAIRETGGAEALRPAQNRVWRASREAPSSLVKDRARLTRGARRGRRIERKRRQADLNGMPAFPHIIPPTTRRKTVSLALNG
ncbi:hypothetical protein ABTN56_19360, partial [Acinetobacter baumannii]